MPPAKFKVVEAGAPEEFKFSAGGVVVVVPVGLGFDPLAPARLRFKEGVVPLYWGTVGLNKAAYPVVLFAAGNYGLIEDGGGCTELGEEIVFICSEFVLGG